MSGADAGDVDASLAEMAALALETWQPLSDGWTPPTNAEWAALANPHLISVRLAWLTLHKSKDELIEAAEQLGDDGLMDLVGQIGRSADWFEGLHKLLASAECRIMCAYAALTAREANGSEIEIQTVAGAGSESAFVTQTDTQSEPRPTIPVLPS